MPLILFRHFWLFFLAGGIVNVFIWRRRLRQLEQDGRATPAEVARFVRGAAIIVVVLGLSGEAVFLHSGMANPMCLVTLPLSDPRVLPAWILNVVFWLLGLWWIWLGTGAQTLSRFGPALLARGVVRARPYPVAMVRFITTAALLFSVLGSLVFRPDPASFASLC